MPQYVASDVRNRDDETGQYRESVSDEEIIELVSSMDGAGTGDVAEAFDYKQPSAYRRLRALEDEGRMRSRRIGSALFWQVTDEERGDDR